MTMAPPFACGSDVRIIPLNRAGVVTNLFHSSVDWRFEVTFENEHGGQASDWFPTSELEIAP